MIGLRRNKRGDMVLTIDSFVDVDSTPDIQSDYFDCIYINTKSERAFHAILYGASPILSYKCSYKPIFANTAVSGKEQMTDYIVDAYVSDMSNEKVYEIIDKIKKAKEKYGIKQELARPTQPNQIFANILRYLLSRDQRIMGHRLMEKSSLGYINPIFEHYHSMSLFHLAEMFTFKDSMVECGALRKSHYLIKEHLCPKCNKATCCYCQSTYPVNALVPRDVVDYEITEEGIRMLTKTGLMFSNMSNTYDNYMEYSLLIGRLRRQLLETYRKDELTAIVGKLWILDKNQETVRIKESIQAQFCRLFNSHKVSYNNNIFYVTFMAFEDVGTENAQSQLSQEMSRAIRKVSTQIEPDQIICCVLDTKRAITSGQYEEFFDRMNFIELTPDDYCGYSESPVSEEEEIKPQETLDLTPKDDDKIMKRVKLYKQLVAILVLIAGVLILLAILTLTLLR